MASRRNFLTLLGTGIGASIVPSALDRLAAAEGQPLAGAIGLQLWSVRADLPKDLPGALARIRELGIVEVEGAGLWGHSLKDFRKALDDAGLSCKSAHKGYPHWQNDPAGAIEEAQGLGCRWLLCPFIPYRRPGQLSHDGMLKAAELFNQVGEQVKAAGMQFGYHCHGQEFVHGPDGTLFDTLVKETDPELVHFEVDAFWTKAGGEDPAKVIAGLRGRVPLLHIKDMKQGMTFERGSSGAGPEADVVVGTGQLDWPAVFEASEAAGGEIYYIEDESLQPWEQIPQSLAYLNGLRI